MLWNKHTIGVFTEDFVTHLKCERNVWTRIMHSLLYTAVLFHNPIGQILWNIPEDVEWTTHLMG